MLSVFEPIPRNVQEYMIGKSYKKNSIISFDDLYYVKAPYYGFDDEKHIGVMVVHRIVAEEVAEILDELFRSKFPIAKMRLVDDYDGDDEKSMADNNTSSFCYRRISGTENLSNHAMGLAIDINPLVNPYLKKENGKLISVLPPEGISYLDRDSSVKGLVTKNSHCYNAFLDHGWSWGGDWQKSPDYQHFEKVLNFF